MVTNHHSAGEEAAALEHLPIVPEQSLLDEMRAAIEGDRERAAKRGVTEPRPAVTPTPERQGLLERLRRFLLGR